MLREEVLLVVSDYNDILKQLDAKERRLFRDRIQALDRRIAPGLQKVNWTSSKAILEFFLAEATKHCHEAHKMVTSYKEAMARVRDNCATIASTSLVSILKKKVYAEGEFAEAQATHRAVVVAFRIGARRDETRPRTDPRASLLARLRGSAARVARAASHRGRSPGGFASHGGEAKLAGCRSRAQRG